MKHLDQRISTLQDLRKTLIEGPNDRHIKLGSYLLLLDYHINLLTEVNLLANSIKDGDKSFLQDWIQNRINLDDNEQLHTSQSENSQLTATKP